MMPDGKLLIVTNILLHQRLLLFVKGYLKVILKRIIFFLSMEKLLVYLKPNVKKWMYLQE